MLLKFFKGTSPGVIFLIALTMLALWLSAFFHQSGDLQHSSADQQMPLYMVLRIISGSGHVLMTGFAVSMAVAITILITNFNTTIFFINERTFLPALLYILIIAIFPEQQVLNPAIPAALMLLLALKRIMDGYHKQGIAYNFFDAGILISAGSLFYASLIWFGLLIIIGILLLRTVTLSEIAVSLLGLITPYLITFGLYYVMGYDLNKLSALIYQNLFEQADVYPVDRLTIMILIFDAAIVLISIGYIVMLQNTKKIKSRKTFSLLIWLFIISLIVYLVMPSASVEMIWISGIPACYFLSHYFIFAKKKLISEIIFTIIYLLILLNQGLYVFL